MTKEEVGERLKELREERGQSKTFVSKKLGLNYRTLCAYEYGERTVPDRIKQMIADYYGLSVDDIFFRKTNHES